MTRSKKAAAPNVPATPPIPNQITKEVLTAQIAGLQREFEQHIANANACRGAIQALTNVQGMMGAGVTLVDTSALERAKAEYEANFKNEMKPSQKASRKKK